MTDAIAFENDPEIKKTRELKVGGKRSMFQAPAEEKREAEERTAAFNNRAEQFMQNRQSKQDTGIVLAKRFFGAMRDKSLNKNKGVISQDAERELREDLQKLILDLNNDPEEKFDGMGSLSSIMMVMRVLFEMRDRVNELEYEVALLKREESSTASAGARKDEG